MNAHQISGSNILDIIFDGRNKEYGAYQLRKTYNRRMAAALALMIAITSAVSLVRSLAGTADPGPLYRQLSVKETVFTKMAPEEKLQRPPEAPKVPKIPKIASVQFSNIRVEKDDHVVNAPPSMAEIENAQIDVKTSEGAKFEGFIAPPAAEEGTNVIGKADNKMKDEGDIIIMDVQVQASFPGGNKAWLQYVQKAVEKRLNEFSEEDFGTCVIRFIVDKTGNVSDVHAVTMQGSKLAEIAANAIRNGPRWIPAQQNGRYVNAYRLQPVTLKSPY